MDSKDQNEMELETKPETTTTCDQPVSRVVDSIENKSDISKSTSSNSLSKNSNISDISKEKFDVSSIDMYLNKFIKPEIKNWTSSPNQNLRRRTSRRQISLNVLIVGEPGLGQKTFIQSLISNNTIKKGNEAKILEEPEKIIGINMIEKSYSLTKDGQRIILNLINVPYYGCGLKTNSTFSNILDYVNGTFMDCFKMECSLDRISTEDRKIHCCLYFISPYGHSLKPLDIEFMKLFQTKFNIIPIIPKSDNFTKPELEKFKINILKDFENHNIKLFEYLNNSQTIDNDLEDAYELWEALKDNIPFSIATSKITTLNSKRLEERIRQYPWGTLKTNDIENNNYLFLENILLKTHINYLKLVTKNTFYENFRVQYILDHVN